MSKVILTAQNINYELHEKAILRGVTVSIKEKGRVGLVGKNGAGKSTFLKILAGKLKPTEGSVISKKSSHYLPQMDFSLFKSEKTVENYITKEGGNWPLVNAALHRWFKTPIQSDRIINTLSGGEIVKLHLAIVHSKDPKLLLLDEPTNHLDLEGVEILRQFLKGFAGAVVIISHDPFFLDSTINHIWEISNGSLQQYGGNYSDYIERKKVERGAKEREYETARKELRKIKRSVQTEQKRSAQSRKKGERKVREGSMSAIEKGYLKNKASATAGKKDAQLKESLEASEEKTTFLRGKKTPKTRLSLSQSTQSDKRTLIRVEGGQLKIEEKTFIKDIDFQILYGDRFVFVGKNGVGKSSLVKALFSDENIPDLDGKVYRSPNLNAVYVDQKYQIIDPNLSLFENVNKCNANLSEAEVREQLSRFMFFNAEDVNKKGEVLSGGEAARLTLAMVTAKPVDLLILDEPTNNLDLETLDAITNALGDFPGSVIVISHNTYFLQQLEIERTYIINNQRILQMHSSPLEPDEFHNEILDSIKI